MITQDEKEQIFALYWMQRVGVNGNGRREILCDEDFIPYLEDDNQLHLELKPLSLITDEDLKTIGFNFPHGTEGVEIYFTPDSYECHWSDGDGKYLPSNQSGYLTLKDFDYLRSRGYALPAFGHSVDELVSEGVFKLIEP